MTVIFGSKLNKLNKKGKLTEVIKKFENYINESKFLGFGNDATAFKYENNSIIKLCTKDIGYFRKYPKATTNDFFKLANSLHGYLLPIEEILYEDDYIFVYVQPFCQILDKLKITHKIFKRILAIEYILLLNNVATSTTTHNLAIYNDNIIIFDYHDIWHIDSQKKEKITKNLWWNKFIKHFIGHASLIYAPMHYLKYTNMTKKLGIYVIEELKNDIKLSPFILELLEYIYTNRYCISKSTLLPYLDRCINDMTLN